MNRKTISYHVVVCALFAFLALFVAGCNNPAEAKNNSSGAAAVAQSPSTSSPSAAPKKDVDAKTLKDGVVARYFHGNRRCRTCLGIQEVVANTVASRFFEEINSGRLVFEEINTEDPKNTHYTQQYQLAFSTLVVEARKDGKVVKWENCSKVWDLARDHDGLANYVEERVRAFLKLAE